MYCCTDDPDDGMGLPVQLSPTDDERGTMCRCKPRPTTPSPTTTPTTLPPPPPPITVSFKEVSYSAIESRGIITFTVQASQASSDAFSVEFCTQNSSPVSAEGKYNILLVYKVT